MAGSTDIGFDFEFFKSTDGIFKLIQFVLSLLFLSFVAASNFWHYPSTQFVGFAFFAAIFGFVTLIFSVIIYTFQLYNGLFLDRLPWINTELFYAIGSALLNFTAMIICAVASSNNSSISVFAAAAIISAFMTVAFLVYAFIIFRGHIPRSASESG